jgi:uncharacterized protein (TIGR02453 family)
MTKEEMPVFSRASVSLLRELGARTDRGPWYHERREDIERLLLAPARRLVVDVGERLRLRIPDLVVDPRIDRGVYRLYRDTRFSGDKRPYKGHIGVLWWRDFPEGKMESPSFYFHLAPGGWLWASGVYRFPARIKAAWRGFLADPLKAERFLAVASELEGLGLGFGEPELKRVPKELEGTLAADWGRREGLCAWGEEPVGPLVLGPNLADELASRLERTTGLLELLGGLYLQAKAGDPAPAPGRRSGGRKGGWTDDF